MTSPKKTYNGHPSRALWNVSLWLSNDEGLYDLGREAVRRTRTKDEAAEYMLASLEGNATPDGYKYTKTSLRYALRHFE